MTLFWDDYLAQQTSNFLMHPRARVAEVFFCGARYFSIIGVFTEIIKFGVFIGDIDIAIVVCRLYRDALAPSTKSTYKTGVRHLQRFKQKYPKAPFPSDVFQPPSKVSISLAFFTAYLFELESIKSHSTIRN